MTLYFYKGGSKCSDLYLEALARDIFEKHAMHHSKELSFIFIMMLIFSHCSVSSYSYSILYIAHSFSCYRIIIIFESEYFKPSIFETKNKPAL